MKDILSVLPFSPSYKHLDNHAFQMVQSISAYVEDNNHFNAFDSTSKKGEKKKTCGLTPCSGNNKVTANRKTNLWLLTKPAMICLAL